MHSGGCIECPELVAFRRQIVLPTPCRARGLLAIGEAPGADEDLAGEGFVGQAGKKLHSLLASHRLERRRGYGVANLIACRPPGNRKPSKGELGNCLGKLAAVLLDIRPKVLLLVGGSAAEAFLGRQPLSVHIERSRVSSEICASDSHPALREAIRTLQQGGALHVIPMPHTSGLAWNRKAPDGRMWREVGAEQVSLAVSLLSS
ncbi:MAG: hypothetical protein B7X93_10615 [Hydrogenophilales bacterium 17-61-9]|nr:MAG: hypothetical protein B7X93_10615 [Hydrogenophilales bacterium 17-61-9]